MAQSTNLQLPYVEASQAQKHVTVNESVRLLDAIIRTRVTEQGLTTPPGSPADGTVYIPGSGASGAWTSWDFNLAYYVDGAWKKIVPKVGWLIYDIAEGGFYVFESAPSYWVAVSLGGSPPRRSVRVATTGDIAIATALNSGDAIDGVTLADGDLVLVKDQAAAAENGVYAVGATPSRHADYNTFDAHAGVLLTAEEGVGNADTLWLCTSNRGGTLGTTAISFAQFTGGGGGGGAAAYPPGFVRRTVANNSTDATNDLDFADVACRDSSDTVDIAIASMTKRLDAGWAAGTNNGMRNSAAAIANTTYHFFACAKAGGADPDIYAHTSSDEASALTALQAETGGADYIYARRIFSLDREANALWSFIQDGDRFFHAAKLLDLQTSNPGENAQLRTLSVPQGIKVVALFSCKWLDVSPAAKARILITSPDQTDSEPSDNFSDQVTDPNFSGSAAYYAVLTNTLGQVRTHFGGSTPDHYLDIILDGWIDVCGRNG